MERLWEKHHPHIRNDTSLSLFSAASRRVTHCGNNFDLASKGSNTAAAFNAGINSIATQGVMVAAGLQEKFSWKSVAASAVAAAVSNQIGKSIIGENGIGSDGKERFNPTETLVPTLVPGLAKKTLVPGLEKKRWYQVLQNDIQYQSVYDTRYGFGHATPRAAPYLVPGIVCSKRHTPLAVSSIRCNQVLAELGGEI